MQVFDRTYLVREISETMRFMQAHAYSRLSVPVGCHDHGLARDVSQQFLRRPRHFQQAVGRHDSVLATDIAD